MNIALKKEETCYCEKCADRAERYNQRMLDKEDLMFDLFDQIKSSTMLKSSHSSKRSLERAFSFNEVIRLFNNKLTFPISHYYDKWTKENLLIFFATKEVSINGEKKIRPVHIVIGYNKRKNESTIVTAYYPDTGKNKHFWKDNYIERACFCKKEEYIGL